MIQYVKEENANSIRDWLVGRPSSANFLHQRIVYDRLLTSCRYCRCLRLLFCHLYIRIFPTYDPIIGAHITSITGRADRREINRLPHCRAFIRIETPFLQLTMTNPSPRPKRLAVVAIHRLVPRRKAATYFMSTM